jgi:hypothetical protein
MRNLRQTVSLAAIVLLTGTAIACAPDRSPMAPALEASDVAAPRMAAAPAPWTVAGLRRERPLRTDLTVTQVIGPRGGRLTHAEAGLTLEVPAGAVSQATTFRVTALAGDQVAYDFGPDGAVFPINLRATQDLRGTNAPRLPRNVSFTLGQLGPDGQPIAAPSPDQQITGAVDRTGRAVTFGVPHFSGWIIMYRNGQDPDSTQVP